LTNLQLYLSIGVPMLFNAILISILMAYINAKIGTVNTRIDGVDTRLNNVNASVNSRIDSLKDHVNERFNAIDQRFDDMRDLWCAELRRVEEVLDARLKHLEEK
jgi:flagellar capping protein FliD